MSALSSQASADSISDSPELGFDTPSSVSRTLGGDESSIITSPAFPSITTSELWVSNQRRELRLMDVSPALTHSQGGLTQAPFLLESISSAEASPVRTFPCQDDALDSPETSLDSSSISRDSSMLFDPDGFSSRTYRVSSLATAVGTSESCLERWPTSGTASVGEFSTASSSECRSVDGDCFSSEPRLTEILEQPENVPERFYLSARAAGGILKRAVLRGKPLPQHLKDALTYLAQSQAPSELSPEGHVPLTSTATEPMSWRARRLTPREFERLQGLPDGWTAVMGERPDVPRYSGCGDAVSVPVAEWLGRRLRGL